MCTYKQYLSTQKQYLQMYFTHVLVGQSVHPIKQKHNVASSYHHKVWYLALISQIFTYCQGVPSQRIPKLLQIIEARTCFLRNVLEGTYSSLLLHCFCGGFRQKALHKLAQRWPQALLTQTPWSLGILRENTPNEYYRRRLCILIA